MSMLHQPNFVHGVLVISELSISLRHYYCIIRVLPGIPLLLSPRKYLAGTLVVGSSTAKEPFQTNMYVCGIW